MADPTLLEGVAVNTVDTPRLRTRLLSSGAEGGAPVLFVHGNVSSSRFFEETLEGVMNSAEDPHWDADSSVSSVLRRSSVFRISKPFLNKFITPSKTVDFYYIHQFSPEVRSRLRGGKVATMEQTCARR